MKKEFWLERWDRGEIGFHQNEVNPYLMQYWHLLQLPHNCTVFVPLCGKSRDMLWLRDQGHKVLGVELSALATNAFFLENKLNPRHVVSGKFELCEADGIHIMCGDFFDLAATDLETIGAVYDRASLIALPPEMRRRYVRHLVDVLPSGTKILLITIDYPQAQMDGPPFSVSPDQVMSLYADYADVRLEAKVDVLAENPRFQERGLTRLEESIFSLTLRKSN